MKPRQSELVFLLGSDHPNKDDFLSKQKLATTEFLKNYHIKPSATAVALIENSEDNFSYLAFKESKNINVVLSRLKEVKNPPTGTNLQQSLKYVLMSVFTKEQGSSLTASKSVIVFLDSSFNGSLSQLDDQVKLLEDAGVKVILIGLGADQDHGLTTIVDVFFFPEELGSISLSIKPVIQKTLDGMDGLYDAFYSSTEEQCFFMALTLQLF